MSGVLFPLAAAVLVKDIEPPEERVALTAAAALINGPMALAPAIVRLQRARAEGGSGTAGQTVGPEMVEVPPLEGAMKEEALQTLKDLKLKPVVKLHESSADKAGRVFGQEPAAEKWVSVGSTVTLAVHNGPPDPGEEKLADVLVQLRDEVVELRKELSELKAAAAEAAYAASGGGGPAGPASP